MYGGALRKCEPGERYCADGDHGCREAALRVEDANRDSMMR